MSGLPYRGEIIDLDAPPTEPAGGQLIDAHDRFTTAPQRPQPRCRDCDQPGILYVLPHVDHRRRKPWPQPYWLCQAHAATSTTC